jgi:hypothetical protein
VRAMRASSIAAAALPADRCAAERLAHTRASSVLPSSDAVYAHTAACASQITQNQIKNLRHAPSQALCEVRGQGDQRMVCPVVPANLPSHRVGE